jgi:hypothetical protein
MKAVSLFLLCLISTSLFSQKDTLLANREKRLANFLNILRNSSVDQDKINANVVFRDYLLETIQYPTSYSYSFESLTSLGIITSPDNAFKLYCWNVEMEDASNRFYCFLVRKGKRNNKNKVIEFLEKNSVSAMSQDVLTENNWYGALYYKIIPVEKGSKKIYTLLGWRSNGTLSHSKLIDVISIHGTHVKFGDLIFKNKRELKRRVCFEYSKKSMMSLKYEINLERIIFDHLSPESPSMTGFFEYYVPDMSYDAYFFEEDKWVLKEDVIGVNSPDKQTIKQTTIDPATGKIIEIEVTNEWVDPSDKSAPGGGGVHTPVIPRSRKK